MQDSKQEGASPEMDELKQQMASYRDIFGNPLCCDLIEITEAKTKQDLISLLEQHRGHLESLLSEAEMDTYHFQRRLKLS